MYHHHMNLKNDPITLRPLTTARDFKTVIGSTIFALSGTLGQVTSIGLVGTCQMSAKKKTALPSMK